MDPVITTGIFAAATTAGGTLLGYSLNALSQRSASRSATRQQAQDLFVQVAKAITILEAEKASFRERRDSRRANALAAGSALLHVLAGRAEGNWVKGAATGAGSLMAWDSDEGARFVDRFQAARAEITVALVQLSLMSDGLQFAAGEVSDALDAVLRARKPGDAGTANQRLQRAIAGLRAAVRDYGAGKPRKRGKQGPPALPAA